MIGRRRNTEALHLIEKRRALQAKPGGGPSRTSQFPIGALASDENLSAHLIFERGVGKLGRKWLRLAAFERRRLKDPVVGKNDAARNIVLKFSNIAWPVVAHE